jgi:hypothetical protein
MSEAAPWEDYSTAVEEGPWTEYSAQPEQPAEKPLTKQIAEGFQRGQALVAPLTASMRIPGQLLDKAADYIFPSRKPLVPPETFKKIITGLTGGVEEPGTTGEVVKDWTAEQLSGLTHPKVLLPAIIAKRFPITRAPIGGYFAAQTAESAPEAAQQIVQGVQEKDPEKAVRGTLGLAASVAIPAAIAKGLRTEIEPSGIKPTEEPSPTPKAPEVPAEAQTGVTPTELPLPVAPEAPPAPPAPETTITPPPPPESAPQTAQVPPAATPEPAVEAGPGGAGPGTPHITEVPETGAGGEKYGIAERVREERAKAGQVEPVEPGQGINTPDSIERGREIIRADPESAPKLMAAFEADPAKNISADSMAVARAHGEALAAGARNIEERFGTESPEYEAAKKALSDWDKRSKPMQTEWQKIGMAQQGETDIDTGSFTGLERAREQSTGQGIPEEKIPTAKKIAAGNKSAQDAVNKASQKLSQRIQGRTDAEKAAFDAANKTVREWAIKRAELENKARVAQAGRDKQVADIQLKRAQKAEAAAQKVVRDMAARAAKEARRRQGDPSIAVWEKANKYLEENQGLYNFDDLRNKIATDLGMKPSQVTYWLSKDAVTKKLADDLWLKQRNARRLKEAAKTWLRELDTPGYMKALGSIPRAMFGLSVFGHGFVALGTHAPMLAFQPRFWGAYVRNFGKMYKMVFSPTYYEAQMADLVRRPNYAKANRSGLQNNPHQYEEYHTTAMRDLVTGWIGEKNINRIDNLASAGNRGYGVLKLLRQDVWDQKYNKLPDSVSKQEGVAEALSDDVNHVTGVTRAGAPRGSNLLLFAPRLAGSRVMWLGGDPIRAAKTVANWKKASTAERVFAVNQMREKGWVLGTFASLLALNQGVLTGSGSKQKINGIPESLGGAGFDPLAADFMKFKALGGNIAYGGATLTMAKLPARVAMAILYDGKGSKYILEDERVDKVIGSYVRSQMSPFAGTMYDLATGRDYEGRPLPAKLFGTVEQTQRVPKRLQQQGVDEPYTWAEFAATKLPIPIAEGIKEGLRGSGMPEDQIKYWLKAAAVTSLMTATGTRITEDTREE